MLVNQRIIPRDASDEETKHGDVDHQREQEEQLEGMPFEERMLRALEGRNDGRKIEVPEYAGNLKSKELINWLNSMEFFFEWKPMTEEKKVKFTCTKLKGHAMIWWDHVQKDRTKKGKDKIKTWKKMEKRLREKFLPLDYAQTLFRQFQNLK